MHYTTPSQFLEHFQSDAAPHSLDSLEKLVEVLRGPTGCPWDQKQTALSMIDCLIDEAHELKEALLRGSDDQVGEEYGDLLFTTTFFRQLMEEKTRPEGAVKKVVTKMITRHPHVFEPNGPVGEAEIRRTWEGLKIPSGSDGENRRLDRDLPASLPAIKRAEKILSRARNAGFRYPTPQQAWHKVEEEFLEIQRAVATDDKEAQAEELGDLLLALLTAAKELGLDAGQSLKDAGRKLSDRIETLERLAERRLCDIPTVELSDLYQRSRGQKAPDSAYFNYCGVGRWPKAVLRAVSSATQRIAQQGLTAVLELREERERLRSQIGRLVEAAGHQVVFLPNISAAALGVAYSLDWKEGDSVLLGRHEFPANSIPWKLAAKMFGINVVEFDEDLLRTSPVDGWAKLELLLENHHPKLLAISAVSYWSGFRVSLAKVSALCQKTGTLLFVDAIQALGTVPVRMSDGIDLLAGGSHKGLLAPEGSGFLVVDPKVREHWVARVGSWLSLPDPVDFLQSGRSDCAPNVKTPRANDPSVLESSSLNTLGYAGLSAALDVLEGYGIPTIASHIQTLHDPLEQGMVELGWSSLRSPHESERSAILSFGPPAHLDLVSFQVRLKEKGLDLGTPQGVLRFGCHIFNTQAEINYALQTVATVMSES